MGADFAVSAAIRAVDKLSGVLHGMGNAVGKFGTQTGNAFDKANAKASLFKKILGANILGNLATDAIRRIGREIKQLPKMIEDFAARGQEIGRTASVIGTTADNWQRLSYAAKATNTPVETLQGSMQKLNKNMADLTVGKGTLKDLVRFGPPGLGKMIRGTHDTTEAMMLLADAMQKTKDPQVRARMAIAAFGKAGQDMIPFLLQGREGLHKLMKEADKYGTVLDDKAIAASRRLEGTLSRLRGTVQSVKDQVLGFVVRAITPYVEKALEWLAANKEIVATKIENFITRVTQTARELGPALKIAWDVVSWLITHKDAMIGIYIAWIALQIALNIAMHANPIGLVVLAIEALIGVAILIVLHWKEIVAWVKTAWESIKTFAVGLWNTVIPYMKAFGGTLMKYWLLPINLVIDAIRGLLWVFSKLPGKAGAPFQGALEAVTGFQDKMNKTLTGSENQFGFGELWKNAVAPNAGMQRPDVNVTVPVNVDNSRAPGTRSSVRQAPPILGYAGQQFAAGSAH